jgi:hypothetical protein
MLNLGLTYDEYLIFNDKQEKSGDKREKMSKVAPENAITFGIVEL